MIGFLSGKRDGYIYGYIFYSGRSRGIVLDEGAYEYPVDSAEFLIYDKFVLVENITIDLLQEKGLYGSKARITDDRERVKNDAKLHL